MKRTTIVLFSVLGVAFITTIATTVILSIMSKTDATRIILSSSAQDEQPFSNVRHIVISTRAPQVQEDLWVTGNISVQQAAKGEQSKLFYPQSPYMKVTQRHDTLFATLDLTTYPLTAREKRRGSIDIDNFYLKMLANKELVSLTSDVRRADMYVDGYRADTLHIHSINQNLYLNDSQLQALNVTGEHTNLTVNSSHLTNFHLELTNLIQWEFSPDTHVNTLFLYGSSHLERTLDKKIFNRVVWDPQGALELNLRVYDKVDMKLTPRDE